MCYTLARWIDDTHIIFAFREDKRAIKTMTLVNSLANPRPTTDTYKMPMPGDSGVSQYDIALFNADTQEKIPVSIAKYPDQKVEISYSSTPGYVFFNPKKSSCRLYRLVQTRYSYRKSRGTDIGTLRPTYEYPTFQISPHQ